jgi:hypothetical protein
LEQREAETRAPQQESMHASPDSDTDGLVVLVDSPVQLPPATLALLEDTAAIPTPFQSVLIDEEVSQREQALVSLAAARDKALQHAHEELARLRPLTQQLQDMHAPGGALDRLRRLESELSRLQAIEMQAARLGAVETELDRVRSKYGELLTLVLEVAPEALERRKF